MIEVWMLPIVTILLWKFGKLLITSWLDDRYEGKKRDN